jgi:triacylglycerol esterase/lipase EstA (alpha/beta hydrolase family)
LNSFVAVSGINISNERTADDTFTASIGVAQTRSWLKDFLPEDIPHSRVLLYNYNASLVFDRPSLTILEFAKDFLRSLLHARKHDPHRPIIFIAHSMGGLIVREAYIIASQDAEFAPVKEATRSFMFLGTPHRGSRIGSFGSIESTAATIIDGLFITPKKRWPHKLVGYTPPARTMSEMTYDCRLWKGVNVVNFYETLSSVSQRSVIDRLLFDHD